MAAFIYDNCFSEEEHAQLCNAAFAARGREAEKLNVGDHDWVALNELLWDSQSDSDDEVEISQHLLRRLFAADQRPKVHARQYFALKLAERDLIDPEGVTPRARQPEKSWKEYRDTQFHPQQF